MTTPKTAQQEREGCPYCNNWEMSWVDAMNPAVEMCEYHVGEEMKKLNWRKQRNNHD